MTHRVHVRFALVRGLSAVVAALSALVVASAAPASADAWNLPQSLQKIQTDVRFSMPPLTRAGRVTGIRGKLYLERPSDPFSVRGEITIPSNGIELGDPMSDTRFQAVVAMSQLDSTQVAVRRFKPDDVTSCQPQSVDRGRQCTGAMEGTVAAGGSQYPISFPCVLRRVARGYEVSGASAFHFTNFPIAPMLGVEGGTLRFTFLLPDQRPANS